MVTEEQESGPDAILLALKPGAPPDESLMGPREEVCVLSFEEHLREEDAQVDQWQGEVSATNSSSATRKRLGLRVR